MHFYDDDNQVLSYIFKNLTIYKCFLFSILIDLFYLTGLIFL